MAGSRRRREAAFTLQMNAMAAQGTKKGIQEQVREFEKDR